MKTLFAATTRLGGSEPKRRYLFKGVIHGLHDAPYNGSMAFVKWRVSTGRFSSSKKSGMAKPAIIRNNSVNWECAFEFEQQLQPKGDAAKTKLFVSVHQLRSGTDVKRIGFVEISLAGYVSGTIREHSLYLLQDSKSNAMLKISVKAFNDSKNAVHRHERSMSAQIHTLESMQDFSTSNLSAINHSPSPVFPKKTLSSPSPLSIVERYTDSKLQQTISPVNAVEIQGVHDVIDSLFDMSKEI